MRVHRCEHDPRFMGLVLETAMDAAEEQNSLKLDRHSLKRSKKNYFGDGNEPRMSSIKYPAALSVT